MLIGGGGKSLVLLVKELLLRQAHRLLAPVEVELTSSARGADVPLSMRTVLRHKEPPLREWRRACIASSWQSTVTWALAGFLDVVGGGEARMLRS
jgi:hypothetical protein